MRRSRRWEKGVFVPVRATTGILASIARRNCEQVFLRLLDKTTAEGRFRRTLDPATTHRNCFRGAPIASASKRPISSGQCRRFSPRVRSTERTLWSQGRPALPHRPATARGRRMTSRQRLRRSAAVPSKLLNLLVRRFSAAVLRRCVPRNPHTPMRSAALLERAAGAWKAGGARANPVECQPSRLHESLVRRWRSAGDDTVRPPHP